MSIFESLNPQTDFSYKFYMSFHTLSVIWDIRDLKSYSWIVNLIKQIFIWAFHCHWRFRYLILVFPIHQFCPLAFWDFLRGSPDSLALSQASNSAITSFFLILLELSWSMGISIFSGFPKNLFQKRSIRKKAVMALLEAWERASESGDPLRKLFDQIDNPGRRLQVPDVPYHTQSVERHIKLITEVSLRVYEFKNRHHEILNTLQSRKEMQKFDNKRMFPLDYAEP